MEHAHSQKNSDDQENCHLCGNLLPGSGRPWQVWCSGCMAEALAGWPRALHFAGVVGLLHLTFFGFTGVGAMGLLLVWVLVLLSLIDINTRLLPDDIVLPLLWAGLVLNAFGGLTSLTSAVLGAAAGYLSLWGLYWAGRLATGEEPLGYGDFKLTAALGAWLGLPAVAVVLLSAAMLHTGWRVVSAMRGRAASDAPFGPFLAAGGFIALMARALRPALLA